MSIRRLDDDAEIGRMALVLHEAEYRNLAQDSTRLRIAVARRLFREGLDEVLLRLLWRYAQECGQTPARLFAYWMDRPSRTIEKVNEMKERSAWARRVLEQNAEAQKPRREEAAPVLQFKRRQA